MGCNVSHRGDDRDPSISRGRSIFLPRIHRPPRKMEVAILLECRLLKIDSVKFHYFLLLILLKDLFYFIFIKYKVFFTAC